MSEVKNCPNCGTTLSASAVFCYSCGQKQTVAEKNETEQIAESANSDVNRQQEVETGSNEGETASKEIAKPVISPVEPIKPVEQPTEPKPAPQAQAPQNQPKPAAPAAPAVQQVQANTAQRPPVQAAPMQAASNNQQQYPAQMNQPHNFAQGGMAQGQNAPAAQAKKKKFPWFFSIVWFILFVAVGIWAYFFFADEVYRPQFTEDAQRFVLFTVAIGMLVYTLSLKFSVKKLKALPITILIVGALIFFYFFCMVELIDGDPLHDFVSGITSSILPTSGE